MEISVEQVLPPRPRQGSNSRPYTQSRTEMGTIPLASPQRLTLAHLCPRSQEAKEPEATLEKAGVKAEASCPGCSPSN